MAQGRREFNYAPDYESAVKMAQTRGGGYDNILKEEVKVFKPHDGVNLVRVLPPTWEAPRHYGLAIWSHGDVGPQNRQYLCLKENPTSPHRNCPVCDALYDLGSRASQNDRQSLLPRINYLYYIIDRDNEREGLQIWRVSQKNTSELAIQSIDRRNKSVLNITHPDKGYDIEFSRVGTGRNGTRYHGFMVMRESTPLSDRDRDYNDWLRRAEDHPLPSLLQFYSPDHIEQVLHGRARDDDDGGGRRRTNGRGGDEYEDEPRRLRRTRDDEPPEDEPRGRHVDDDEPPSRRTRDPDDERPPRRARETEPEDEPRRTREREPDDERPSRRTRDTEDDMTRAVEVDDRPSRRAREPEDDRPSRRREPEPEEPPRRSRLSRDLDDEIPFDRSDAREPEPEPEPTPRRQRERLSDDPPPRRARDDANGDDRHERARERVRQNLNRERD